jgi:hypothetical protein
MYHGMAVSLAQDCASDLESHRMLTLDQSDFISNTAQSLTLADLPTGRGSRRTDCIVSGPAQWSMCEARLTVSVVRQNRPAEESSGSGALISAGSHLYPADTLSSLIRPHWILALPRPNSLMPIMPGSRTSLHGQSRCCMSRTVALCKSWTIPSAVPSSTRDGASHLALHLGVLT